MTNEQKTYLIGKRLENEKMAYGGDHGYKRQEDGTFSPRFQNGNLGDTSKPELPKGRTAERLAKEYTVYSTLSGRRKGEKNILII